LIVGERVVSRSASSQREFRHIVMAFARSVLSTAIDLRLLPHGR